jgi:hypothetical protein
MNESIDAIPFGGDQVSAQPGKTLPVHGPFTDWAITRVPRFGEYEAQQATAAASAALPAWRELTARERSSPLSRLAALMREHVKVLAEFLTPEQGKPIGCRRPRSSGRPKRASASTAKRFLLRGGAGASSLGVSRWAAKAASRAMAERLKIKYVSRGISEG